MTPRLPISVLLLARDAAPHLEALLPTLAFAAEIVAVVDEDSRDDSGLLAERHGARVFRRTLDGFGPQRQFALERCREEWVLWIDADERLPADVAPLLARALARPSVGGYRLGRRGWFLGRPIRFCGWQGERVLRLFRREAARFDAAAVHERVEVRGPIEDLGVRLEHLSYADWAECRRKLLHYSSAAAARNERGRRRASWLDVAFRPPLRFARMYVLQLGFLDGVRGFLLCALASTQVFLKYAERWAVDRARPSKP